MRCVTCEHECPPEARFCPSCGTPTGSSCAACGTPLPAAANFCPRCGRQAGASAEPEASSSGERRHLTVAFIDLVASTEHASSLELEDLRELIRAYQRECALAIDRYGGHVAQYLGDGVLAYFGYPHAEEHAPERAVRAGLAVVRQIRELRESAEMRRFEPIHVRIGIHTGTVLVGEMGGGQRSETLALGQTANIAARLQQLAAPDALLVSGNTLRLLRDAFTTESLGTPPLKGITEPVTVHRVSQPPFVPQRIAPRAEQLTPFVGRDEELALLNDRWERVCEGAGQVVFISGEAGMGKSRLLYTLRDGLVGRPHLWLECGALAYMRRSPFHPVVELVTRGLRFASDDSPAQRLEKLRGGMEGAGGLPPGSLAVLAELLDLPGEPVDENLGPEQRREAAIDALVTWATLLAEQQPVVLAVEDLHWADSSSLELIGALLERVSSHRLLLILTSRPDFEPSWPRPRSWTPLVVDRLRQAQAQSLVGAVAGSTASSGGLLDRIIERADGVPLYLEELTRAALDPEAGAGQIPATLEDALMARLDRSGPAKEVAQVASVLGREFSQELLAAAVDLEPAALDEAIERLTAAEVILESGAPPDARYVFRHALLRDAAYDSLLRPRRRALHARVVDAYRKVTPELATAQPETLAHHLDRAGEAVSAIGYYERAGQRATERSAIQEALAHLRRGLELVDGLDEGEERESCELRLLVALGPTLGAQVGPGDPETGRTYARARALCRDDTPELGHVLAGLFTYHLNRGEMHHAFEIAEEQLAIAQRTDDPAVVMRAHWSLGQALCVRGSPVAAVPELERALELFDPERDRALSRDRADLDALLRCWLARALWLSGRPEAARARSEEALEYARRSGHPYSLAYALGFGAVLEWWLRDRERAHTWSDEAVSVSRDNDFPIYFAVGQLVRIWSEATDPRPAEQVRGMLQHFRNAAGSLAGRGTHFAHPLIASGLSELCIDTGLFGEARETLRSALAYTAQTGIAFWDAELLRLQADLALRESVDGASREAEAERLLQEAIALAADQESSSLAQRAATQLASLWAARGEGARARDLLAPRHAAMSEGRQTVDWIAARDLLRELGDEA